MNRGYFRFWRKQRDWAFASNPSAVALWVYLLREAKFKTIRKEFKKKVIDVKPGQQLVGRKQISIATGISESQVERLLKKFESEQQITQETSNKCRLITIKNWEIYHGDCTTDDTTNDTTDDTTSGQQADNKRTTDDTHLKKEKKERRKERKKSQSKIQNKSKDDNYNYNSNNKIEPKKKLTDSSSQKKINNCVMEILKEFTFPDIFNDKFANPIFEEHCNIMKTRGWCNKKECVNDFKGIEKKLKGITLKNPKASRKYLSEVLKNFREEKAEVLNERKTNPIIEPLAGLVNQVVKKGGGADGE